MRAMKKIADIIVDKRKYVMLLYGILVVLSVIGMMCVNVNYDMSKYLPADSGTKLGMEKMSEEYGDLAIISVMFQGLSEDEQTQIKESIAEIPNVKSVAYLENDEAYHRGDYSKYMVVVSAGTYSDEAREVLRTIRNNYQDYNIAVSGGVVDSDLLVETLTKEIPVIAIIAVIIIFAILFLLCDSWIEPILYMGCIGVAILLNMGTNALLPSVSFMTFAVGALLQLGLSMDYSIMLLNRYNQEKAVDSRPESAMKKALLNAFGAITSSSVTTVAGLLVLVFMSFKIGQDMGIVLAKGVFISLICIFTILPGLVIMFDKVIAKTHKKSLNFKTDFLMKGVIKARYILIPLTAAAAIFAFVVKGSLSIGYIKTFDNEDQQKMEDVFGIDNQIALLYSSSEDQRKVAEYISWLEEQDEVNSVQDYSNTIGKAYTYRELASEMDMEENQAKMVYQLYMDTRDLSDYEEITVYDLVCYMDENIAGSPDYMEYMTEEQIAQIKDARQKLEEGKAELAKAEQEILDGERELAEGREELLKGEREIADGEQKLRDSEKQIADGEKEIEENEQKLIDGEAQIEDAEKEIAKNEQKIKDGLKEIREGEEAIRDGESQLSDGERQLNEAQREIDAKEKTLVEGEKQLAAAKVQMEATEKELTEGQAKLEAGKAELVAKKNEIEEGKVQLEAGFNELNQGKQQLEEGIAQLNLAKEMVKPMIEEQVISQMKELGITDPDQALVDAEVAKAITEMFKEQDKEIEETHIKLQETEAFLINNQKEIEAGEQLIAAAEEEMAVQEAALQAGMEQLLAGKELLAANEAQLKSGREQLEAGKRQLSSAKWELSNGRSELEAGKAELEEGWEELNEGRKQLEDGKKQLQDSKRELEDGRAQLEEGKKELEDGRTQLAEGYTEIANAKNEIAQGWIDLEEGRLDLEDGKAQLEEGKQVYEKPMGLAEIAEFMEQSEAEVENMLQVHRMSMRNVDDVQMTLEEFVAFVTDEVLPNEIYAGSMTDEMRRDLENGQQEIEENRELMLSDNYKRMMVSLAVPLEGDDTFRFIGKMEEKSGEIFASEAFLVGDSTMGYEMDAGFSDELNFVSVLTVVVILLVVIVTFRSLISSAVLVAVIQSAVFIVTALIALMGISVNYIALILVQCILMGSTIDYGILFISNYAEIRRSPGRDKKEAICTAMNRSIKTIMTSSLILIGCCLTIGFAMTQKIIAQTCSVIAYGTMCAVALVIFVLPALAYVLDRFIVRKK